MISVKEAKDIIVNNVHALDAETVSLIDAAGRTLAEDVYASNDFPSFPQSAMDGYAFKFDNWKNGLLAINGEVQAGATQQLQVSDKQATRIFTGAPVPNALDTVVMQEKVAIEDGMLKILDDALLKGSNVRAIGSEMAKGALALEAGTQLTPGAIGFLAGLGLQSIKTIRKPTVAIIVTGKELQTPGQPLSYGQVYESNSFALLSALKQIGISNVTIDLVDDNLNVVAEAIQTRLASVDLLLITGGVSVGDYDFVSTALAQSKVEKLFHKVSQRPGKPLLFAKKDKTIVFGLPGNPSSVLTCFYEYVLLAIQWMMSLQKPLLETVYLPMNDEYSKKTTLMHFLKGKQQDGGVTALDAQESFRMKSFAVADCLIVLEENKLNYKKGDLVEVHLLP